MTTIALTAGQEWMVSRMANVPKYFYFRVHANKTSIEIEDASDADVVEVVRCKDCRCFDISKNGVNGFCTKLGIPVDVYDFCSFGERKDGEQNDDVGHIEYSLIRRRLG